MTSFLESPPYLSHLSNAHPNLRFDLSSPGSPRFLASIDLTEPLISRWIPFLIQASSRLVPRLQNPEILFLGTPFEPYNQSPHFPLSTFDLKRAPAGIDLVMVTNLEAGHPKSLFLKNAGFQALPSFPDMVLPVYVNSFQGHLETLDSVSKRSIQKNLRTFDHSVLYLEPCTQSHLHADELYATYDAMVQNSKIKWISHSPDYFKHLTQLGSNVRLTLAKNSLHQVIGFVVNFKDGDNWHSGRIGIHPDYHRKHALYFRLIYHAIEEAILNNARQVFLSPTSYRVKRQLGARPQPLVNWLLGVSPLWKFLLKTSMPLARHALRHLNNQKMLEKRY